MRIHQQKLEQIAGRHLGGSEFNRAQSVVGPKEGRAVVQKVRKYKMDKARSKDFRLSERNLQVSKDNQLLLSKLVEISSGKHSCLPKINTKRSTIHHTRQSQPQSLNIGVRRKEIDRIERENQAFAKRLFDKQAVLQK
jgi:hypothetical protein